MKVALETNQLIALAMKQIEPHVVAAYPITPSTEVVQEFSQYVANGDVKTEFVPVESEHSAMSACLAASLSGARVMTATASQGLAFMWEMLHIAAASRAPIVTIVANRALSAPINIHGIMLMPWVRGTLDGYSFGPKLPRKLTTTPSRP